MASFLLIDDRGDSKPPIVRVVSGERYAEGADSATIDYLNWSQVGDVLCLSATQHLVRLGAYGMSLGKKKKFASP
jgi:hypothetical protein